MDPWELVDNYFRGVCDTPEAELDPDSLALVRVWRSFGLIQNGGIHSYLCAIGEEAAPIAHAYRHVGVEKACELMLAALDLWKSYRPELDPEEADPDEFRAKFESQLAGIEAEFYDLEDQIVTDLARMVERMTE